jgi:hypothetical protein
MDTHAAHITVGAGSGRAAPIVLRVYAEDPPDDDGAVLLEIPLGVDWANPRGSAPAWTALAKRADTALAELGYARTVEWQPHVYPRPIAAAKISKATVSL